MCIVTCHKNTKNRIGEQKKHLKLSAIITIFINFATILEYKTRMELQGKVIAALPARSGTSARGEWKAQDFVIETHEAYPKKLVFSVFGSERLERFNIQIGQEVMVSFDIDAHEYNGRWFNSVRAFDVRLVDPATVGAQGAQPYDAAPTFGGGANPVQPQPSPTTPSPDPFGGNAGEGSADDLPF